MRCPRPRRGRTSAMRRSPRRSRSGSRRGSPASCRREHFARLDLNRALRTRLSYAQAAILEREAPTHFVVPSGSRIPIDYLDGEVPTLSVRLQELFGLETTPTVAGGTTAPAAEIAVARRPARANHARSRQLLEAGLPRGEKGSQGPLPQALLAGGSLLCAAHTTGAPPLSRRAWGRGVRDWLQRRIARPAARVAAAGNIAGSIGPVRRNRRGGGQHSDTRHIDDSVCGHRARVPIESGGHTGRAGSHGPHAVVADHPLRAARRMAAARTAPGGLDRRRARARCRAMRSLCCGAPSCTPALPGCWSRPSPFWCSINRWRPFLHEPPFN